LYVGLAKGVVDIITITTVVNFTAFNLDLASETLSDARLQLAG
jgi:hypothetical protein